MPRICQFNYSSENGIQNKAMTGNILIKPFNIEQIQKIKDEVYSNGSRFTIKPHGATPHITIGQFRTNEIEDLEIVLNELAKEHRFVIKRNEWVLTKKFQSANHLMNKDYYWLALLFENNKYLMSLYQKCDELMKKYGINDNESYLENVRKVKEITDHVQINEIKDSDCIANHLNISNYTRPEKAEECWEYIDLNLPQILEFGVLLVSLQEKEPSIIIPEMSLSI